MGFPIVVGWHFYIEAAPWTPQLTLIMNLLRANHYRTHTVQFDDRSTSQGYFSASTWAEDGNVSVMTEQWWHLLVLVLEFKGMWIAHDWLCPFWTWGFMDVWDPSPTLHCACFQLTLGQQCILSVVHSRYLVGWCTGGLRSQCINRHGISPQSRNIPSPASAEITLNMRGPNKFGSS